jgi:mannan polymerase II complex MNN10 subunit
MSLSRSPSPRRGGGGWASPGLTPGYEDGGGSGGGTGAPAAETNGRRPGMWTPRARATTGADSAPAFVRHIRNLSGQLPYFRSPARDYANKEKLGRGRWSSSASQPEWRRRLLPFIGRIAWRLRVPLALLFALVFFLVVSSREYPSASSQN